MTICVFSWVLQSENEFNRMALIVHRNYQSWLPALVCVVKYETIDECCFEKKK
jgi:hypothetical protein